MESETAGASVSTVSTTSVHSVEMAKPSQSSSVTGDEEIDTKDKPSKDLFTWQEKFLKAADKGAEDLSGRVQDITERQISSQILGVGEAFIVKLEQSQSSETSKLKVAINEIVKSVPSHPSKEDFKAAEDQVSRAVRTAAMSIKSNAQSLRSWKQNFVNETRSLVNAASVSTLDVLDNIRDLGLQEIGMRWAWMDGVTYKDWEKYHELKKAFDAWRDEVEAVATKHQGLSKSTSAAEELESKGIAIAEEAAKELSRLKEVGLWKVYARDDTDDFSTRSTPAQVILAQKLAEQSASAFKNGAAESASAAASSAEAVLSHATEGMGDAVSAASTKIVGTEPGFAEQAANTVSEAVLGSSQPVHESVLSAASEKATNLLKEMRETIVERRSSNSESFFSAGASVISEASENIIGTSNTPGASATSAVKSHLDDVASEASSVILGTPPPKHETLLSDASKANNKMTSSASSIAHAASNKVFGGAMAQHVAEQMPIFEEPLDDDDSYTDRIQKMMDGAGDKVAELTQAVSEALAKATHTQGSFEKATSVAADKYSSALAAASSALYGPESGTAEKLSKAAADRYSDAVSA